MLKYKLEVRIQLHFAAPHCALMHVKYCLTHVHLQKTRTARKSDTTLCTHCRYLRNACTSVTGHSERTQRRHLQITCIVSHATQC